MPVTVLIVDDDATFRRLAARLLSGLGYLVAGEAADGAQAIEASARLRPDAVLLDVRLPDTDGVSVARRLAKHDGAPRVLLTSSDPSQVDEAIVAGSGAVAFVAKIDLVSTDLAPHLCAA
jgi:CheY-like chemotaxis protein